jgi:hypothetical protein
MEAGKEDCPRICGATALFPKDEVYGADSADAKNVGLHSIGCLRRI